MHSQSQAIAALEKQYSDQEKKSSNIQNKLENSQKLIEAKDHDITWLKASISELENKIKQQSSHLDNRYTELGQKAKDQLEECVKMKKELDDAKLALVEKETSDNPADLATRCLNVSSLADSAWLKGPRFLRNPDAVQPQRENIQPAEDDPEVRREVIAHASCIYKCRGLGAERFSRFSNLHSLKRAIARLIVKVKEFRRQKNEQRPPKARQTFRSPTANELNQAMDAIIRAAQKEAFGAELTNKDLTEQKEGGRYQNTVRKRALKGSQFYALDPFIDANGILRVGGRLRRAELDYGEKHPAILPKDHHVSVLVIRHYHKEVHHQGRQITSGKIRQAGYWLIGGHRMVAKELASCVPCKKLRGPHVIQKMADLPQDRTEVGPPFTNVGFDVFGPWTISTRKTRGGAAHSKRWGLVFTCLNSRAIHIEVLESMDASSFICALRRFFAIRGPTAVLRCDIGNATDGGG